MGGLVLHVGAGIQHLLDGFDLHADSTCTVGGREVLNIEFTLCAMRSNDVASCLPLPVEAPCPACEDASDGFVAVVVATEDENLASHVAHLEVRTIIDEETSEVLMVKQLLDACVIDALHLVAIGSMEHVDDDKLGRVLPERVTQKLQDFIEMNFGGHDAVIDVDVVFVYAGTQVESTHASSPLLADGEVLGACIAVAEHSDEATESVSRCGIVGTRNGERCHIRIIRQSTHPVSSQKSGDVPCEGDTDDK